MVIGGGGSGDCGWWVKFSVVVGCGGSALP